MPARTITVNGVELQTGSAAVTIEKQSCGADDLAEGMVVTAFDRHQHLEHQLEPGTPELHPGFQRGQHAGGIEQLVGSAQCRVGQPGVAAPAPAPGSPYRAGRGG